MSTTGRFKWLSAMVAVMVLVMASAAFADDLPRTAVYVTGELGENEKKALGTRILVNLFNSGRYSSAERAAHFLAEADKERQTRGAAIDDGHISELGKRFDINVVCVVDVTPVLGEFQISARIVNVETAGIEHLGAAASPLKSLSDLEQVSELVVKNMFSAQAAQAAEAETAPEITIEPETESIAQASAPMPADTPIETSPSPPKGPLKAAVYVTGIPPMAAKPFNSAISSALIKSKIYAGIESIEVSGAPSVPTLADAGRNAGVSYIFAINVAGQISVAIIDVAGTMELAKISIDGKITAVSAAVIAKKIVDFILTSGPKPDPDALVAEGAASGQSVGDGSDGKPRRLENRISVEIGGGFLPHTCYSADLYREDESIDYPTFVGSYSSLGRGVYLNVNLIYAEINFDERFTELGYGITNITAKYPIVYKIITVSPMVGIQTSTVYTIVYTTELGWTFGGRIDVGISEIAYLRSEYFYTLNWSELKTSSLKIGGGLDIGLGESKKIYLRPELLYSWIGLSDSWDSYYNDVPHTTSIKSTTHSLELRLGIGYKWGGN